METVSGVSSWKLTVRREGDGITVLRAVTCDPSAILPEALWDLPVTALGDRALVPGRSPAGRCWCPAAPCRRMPSGTTGISGT